MTKPRLILLDEPSMGLAPKISYEIFELIAHLRREEKLSFLVAEQNIELAYKYTDDAYLLENGQVNSFGQTQALYQTGVIQNVYLGQSTSIV
jgi:branched-chain amino acid transport system ATP-binding protein